MEAFLNAVQALRLHPFIDHFTIALLTVGIAIDLVASLAPSRAWLRYMALTLMVLGAIAAAGSYTTGHLELDRVRKALTPQLRATVHWHAEIAESLTVVFAVLAFWRILIEATGFMAGSRPFYLLVAVIAAGVLSYTGYLGRGLVYSHGIGTKLMAATPAGEAPSSTKPAAPVVPNETLPTVSVAAPAPTQTAPPPKSTPEPTQAPQASVLPTQTAAPAATPAPSR